MPNQTADDYLRRVLDLSREMIELAHAGDACRSDVGCGIVFGSVRDNAYKVRKLAEEELRKHAQAEPLTDPDNTRKNQTPKEGAENHE